MVAILLAVAEVAEEELVTVSTLRLIQVATGLAVLAGAVTAMPELLARPVAVAVARTAEEAREVRVVAVAVAELTKQVQPAEYMQVGAAVESMKGAPVAAILVAVAVEALKAAAAMAATSVAVQGKGFLLPSLVRAVLPLATEELKIMVARVATVWAGLSSYGRAVRSMSLIAASPTVMSPPATGALALQTAMLDQPAAPEFI